jgi:hypothetical protein
MEQQIMECWHVVSDIKTLSEEVIEGDYSKDQITNVLLGIEHLYDIRFNKLFRTFEKFLEEYYRLEKLQENNK